MKLALTAVALVLLAACGSDVTGPINVVGTWNLSTVDGKALPVNLLPRTPTLCGVDVRGGQFDLRADGTYSGSIAYGTMEGGKLYCAAEYVEWGTYAVGGITVTLRNSTGFSHTLTIGPDRVTQTLEGRQYVYHR